jgi:FkbH-like protein
VVELSEDPADYPQLLDDVGLFEITTFSAEDHQRTRHYQNNAQREAVRETAADYASYLRSLEQKAVIRPFVEADLDRITQLANKSNQFNLTTLRLSRTEVEELMLDSEVVTATVRLTDRFGDNGLICVLFARPKDDILRIDEWLMSCRVLKRGVEQLLSNYLVEQAHLKGTKALLGHYVPTPKNGLVRDHYKSLGFRQAGTDEHGATHWRLELNTYRPFEVPIEIVESN